MNKFKKMACASFVALAALPACANNEENNNNPEQNSIYQNRYEIVGVIHYSNPDMEAQTEVQQGQTVVRDGYTTPPTTGTPTRCPQVKKRKYS